MKRYFLVHDDHMPTVEDDYGETHWIGLAGHGPAGMGWTLLCTSNDGVRDPHPDWIALPPLYDARTSLAASAVPHEVLADIGLTGEETCVEAVMRMGELHPLMGL